MVCYKLSILIDFVSLSYERFSTLTKTLRIVQINNIQKNIKNKFGTSHCNCIIDREPSVLIIC